MTDPFHVYIPNGTPYRPEQLAAKKRLMAFKAAHPEMTQRDLARMIGVSLASVCVWLKPLAYLPDALSVERINLALDYYASDHALPA